MTVNKIDSIYRNLVAEILANGEIKKDRTGVGTKAIFGYQYRIDVSQEQFPILTTKKVLFESIVKELLWFLSGSMYIEDLKCGIWDEWADNGIVKWSYGRMWRSYPPVYVEQEGTDQIYELVQRLRDDRDSRRHIVCAWNPSVIDHSSLPPCHTLFQCFVSADGCLDLQLYQRSVDVCLGLPFNISSYSLLLILLARECGYRPRYFIHSLGDAHIYLNHCEKVKEQIDRIPYALPALAVPDKSIFDLNVDDYREFRLTDYRHHKFIKFDIAI